MKKFAYILVLTIGLFSCKRSAVTSYNYGEQMEIWKTPVINEYSVASPQNDNEIITETNSETLIKNPTVSNVSSIEITTTKKIEKKHSKITLTKKEIKSLLSERKGMDPRLSNALAMSIIGASGTTLGILLFSYAPTGALIFAFALVFLVGLISLLMYLANPKPKL